MRRNMWFNASIQEFRRRRLGDASSLESSVCFASRYA